MFLDFRSIVSQNRTAPFPLSKSQFCCCSLEIDYSKANKMYPTLEKEFWESASGKKCKQFIVDSRLRLMVIGNLSFKLFKQGLNSLFYTYTSRRVLVLTFASVCSLHMKIDGFQEDRKKMET